MVEHAGRIEWQRRNDDAACARKIDGWTGRAGKIRRRGASRAAERGEAARALAVARPIWKAIVDGRAR